MTAPGLAAERTALAWRRTALALTLVSLGGTRILAESWGVAAGLLGATGLLVALSVSLGARRRVRARAGGALPGAGLLAAVAVAVVAIGLTALGYAVAR